MGSALASAARQTKLVAACEGARTPNLAPISAILTRREHEVAVLASRGLSDREIAASLHLSVRTVQSHLQRTYRKLRINGRSALPSSLPGAAP
jgi:DNA-binding CsgD family transcriptional regulator